MIDERNVLNNSRIGEDGSNVSNMMLSASDINQLEDVYGAR